MKRIKVFVLFFVISLTIVAYGCELVERNLLHEELQVYSAKAEILIILPFARQDVNYIAKIIALPTEGNKKDLCQSDYLIEIEDTLGNKSVYSYFDGNYFAYSGGRLREYHWACDSLPFIDRVVKGKSVSGVHKSGIVSALVPSIIDENLKNNRNRILCEIDTVINGDAATIIETVDYNNDVVIKQMSIALRNADHSMLYYKQVTNPGMLSEQIIVINYDKSDDSCIRIDEELLFTRYPDIFKE